MKKEAKSKVERENKSWGNDKIKSFSTPAKCSRVPLYHFTTSPLFLGPHFWYLISAVSSLLYLDSLHSQSSGPGHWRHDHYSRVGHSLAYHHSSTCSRTWRWNSEKEKRRAVFSPWNCCTITTEKFFTLKVCVIKEIDVTENVKILLSFFSPLYVLHLQRFYF